PPGLCPTVASAAIVVRGSYGPDRGCQGSERRRCCDEAVADPGSRAADGRSPDRAIMIAAVIMPGQRTLGAPRSMVVWADHPSRTVRSDHLRMTRQGRCQ